MLLSFVFLATKQTVGTCLVALGLSVSLSHLYIFFSLSFVEFATEQGGLSVDVIKKAFDATEEEFLHLVRRALPARPQIASVGSCCLVGAISNGELYVANLGDSRAVLGRRPLEGHKNSVVAERLSDDHNVAVEEVRKELVALHPDDAHIVVYTRGVWRVKGIIQVWYLDTFVLLLACNLLLIAIELVYFFQF
jgi:hypothetical protein